MSHNSHDSASAPTSQAEAPKEDEETKKAAKKHKSPEYPAMLALAQKVCVCVTARRVPVSTKGKRVAGAPPP